MVGTGLGAQNGILFKKAQALETVHKTTIVIFDKTGTLTKGDPAVTDIVSFDKKTGEVIESTQEINKRTLQLAASLGVSSSHPLDKPIIDSAKKQQIEFLETRNFNNIPGKGIGAEINIDDKWSKVVFGNKSLMKENKIDFSQFENKLRDLENQGKTAMMLGLSGEFIGIIAVADTLKEYSKQAVSFLKSRNKKIIMITGDNKRTAKAIADKLGIDEVLAEVLPQDKANKIKQFQEKGEIVTMVGDGINDAPALAQADLGIAMGAGTDIAMETGEIILIKDDLRDVITAIDLSAYTLKKIKQNLFWAFFYNIVGIPIAAGVLYPITGWLLNPAIAAAAMAFSSISVVLNALSMKRYKLKIKKNS